MEGADREQQLFHGPTPRSPTTKSQPRTVPVHTRDPTGSQSGSAAIYESIYEFL